MICNITKFHTFFNICFFLTLAAALCVGGCTRESGLIQPVHMAQGGSLTLSWDPVPGAVAYHLYFSENPGVTRASGHKIANAANPITVRDLNRGVTYYFVVTAVGANGIESSESAVISRRVE